MRPMKREEMLTVLLAVSDAKARIQACRDMTLRLTLYINLSSLYACIPVDQLIEFVTEAGTRNKGAA